MAGTHDQARKIVRYQFTADADYDAVIGNDSDTSDYFPNVVLTKYGDPDFWLGLDLPELPNGWTSSVDADGKLTLDGPVLSAEIYSDETGLHFDVILKQKPPGSKKSWAFDLLNWQNFRFEFNGDALAKPGATQIVDEGVPVITWTENGITRYRPAALNKTYAVYHASKAGGQYMTGKMCQIGRPEFIAQNKSDFGEVTISNGTMTIDAPPGNFLNTAVYPVRIVM